MEAPSVDVIWPLTPRNSPYIRGYRVFRIKPTVVLSILIKFRAVQLVSLGSLFYVSDIALPARIIDGRNHRWCGKNHWEFLPAILEYSSFFPTNCNYWIRVDHILKYALAWIKPSMLQWFSEIRISAENTGIYNYSFFLLFCVHCLYSNNVYIYKFIIIFVYSYYYI